jgi:type IV pilus assembly protein PilV
MPKPRPVIGEKKMIFMNGNKKNGVRARECTGNDRGFTLLELIMAISILTVGILAVATMQVTSIRGNAYAGGMTEGVTHAADRIEKLMSLAWDDSNLGAGSHNDPSPPSGYAVSWTVTDNTPVSDTKTVEVTVNWTEHGATKNVTMQTVVARVL